MGIRSLPVRNTRERRNWHYQLCTWGAALSSPPRNREEGTTPCGSCEKYNHFHVPICMALIYAHSYKVKETAFQNLMLIRILYYSQDNSGPRLYSDTNNQCSKCPQMYALTTLTSLCKIKGERNYWHRRKGADLSGKPGRRRCDLKASSYLKCPVLVPRWLVNFHLGSVCFPFPVSPCFLNQKSWHWHH